MDKLRQFAGIVNYANFLHSGGLIMYTYKFPTGTTETDEKSDFDKLIETLESYDNSIKLKSTPTCSDDTLGLTKLETISKTDEEIKKEAENELNSYKTKNITSIEDDYNENLSDNSSDIEKYIAKTQTALDQVAYDSNESITDAKKSAVNRGVSRGSVLSSAVSSIEDEKNQSITNLKNESEIKLNTLESEKVTLQEAYNKALNDFDISYAVELENEIKSINEDIAKQNTTISKYNNTINEKESEFQYKLDKEYADQLADVEDQNRDLLNQIRKYGSTGLQLRVDEQKSTALIDYLDQFEKETALAMFLTNKDKLKSVLGQYYSTCLSKLQERE